MDCRHRFSSLPLQQPHPSSLAIFLPRNPDVFSAAGPVPLKYMTYVMPHYASFPPTPIGWPVGVGRQQPSSYFTPMPLQQATCSPPPPLLQNQQMLVPFFHRSAAAMPMANIGPDRECKFCKNNGEPRLQYRTHLLRDPTTNQLICPVLREHECEECGATGDDAHTRNYCPRLKLRLRQALPMSLKRTRRQSDGTIRQTDGTIRQ